jgi:NitT/TauT family transport system substrate-binding protein
MWTNRLRASAAAAAVAVLAGLPATAQDLQPVTFVQPSPSAINSFPVFVAIGEGYFAEEGLNVSVESQGRLRRGRRCADRRC